MSTEYGSDVIVGALAELGIRHVGLNPGATTRGLHDSLIRQDAVGTILTLDERVAVAMAQGYAKSSGRPMAVALHNLVGLLSGSIGVFNSYIDRVPMLVIGGAGPASKLRRRPWIDWIHAVRSQGNAVRDFVKWADEPVDLEDTLDSLVRGYEIAMTPPYGPVYIGIDTEVQEAVVEEAAGRELLPRRPVIIRLGGARPDQMDSMVAALESSRRPVLLTDYVGRTPRGFDALRRFAEVVGVEVVDLAASHNMPTLHPVNATMRKAETLAEADLILAIDVRNASFALSTSDPRTRTARSTISDGVPVFEVGEGPLLDRTFIDLGQRRGGHDVVVADAVVVLEELTDRAGGTAAATARRERIEATEAPPAHRVQDSPERGPFPPATILAATREAVEDGPWIVANSGIRGGFGRDWPMQGFADHLGRSGGGGLGYGVGAAMGVALDVEPGTVVVDLQPDGDLYYTSSGLWTAAHYRLPVLFVVLNNATYGQDLMHQRKVAETRGREMPAPYHGIDIAEPVIDVAGMARSMGVEASDRVEDLEALRAALKTGVAAVREGRPYLIDVAYDG